MQRAEIVRYFEQYVERFRLPVRYGVRVTSIEQKPNDNGYWARANGMTFEAANDDPDNYYTDSTKPRFRPASRKEQRTG
jgi:hypothetical protein